MAADDAVYSVPMKGKGFYNTHSALQRKLMAKGLDLIRRASLLASQNASSPNGASRNIVDYGASHGNNSIEPLQTMLKAMTQTRFVIHMNDRPENDFNSLALTMNKWRAELQRHHETHELFIAMLPRSFYEPLHDRRMIDMGYSFSCLHFLESVPLHHDSHFTAVRSDATLAKIRVQAHYDLKKFLRLRAAEFVAGGALVLSLVCPGIDHPSLYCSGPGEAVRIAMLELCAEGLLSPSDLTSCIIPVYFRTLADVQETLGDAEVQQSWSVITMTQEEVYHPLWDMQNTLIVNDQRTEQHCLDYADSMMAWFLAAFEGFLVMALEHHPERRESGASTEQILEEVKVRSTQIFARGFCDQAVYLPSTFVLLQRKQ